MDRDDPNTEVFELNYPLGKKIEQFRVFTRLEGPILEDEESMTLVVFYFNGISYIEAGKIVTNLGVGPFHLENRMDAFCKGADHVTVWALWDCSREVKQLEAGVNKDEWPDEEDHEGCVSVVSTYACLPEQPLSENNNFVTSISKHLRIFLERDRGQLNLKEVLINMPEAIGTSLFSGTFDEIILFGRAKPLEYKPSFADRAFS